MAPHNKLLLRDVAGRQMVTRTVDAACQSRVFEVVVVTGHQQASIRDALAGRDVRFVHAADHSAGLSASLRAGVLAASTTAEAALICLGDMPDITAGILDRLIQAYRPESGHTIVVPTYRGQRGNPVLWDRKFFPAIAALTGDHGARPLLARYSETVTHVETGDAAVLTDYDTPESLAQRTSLPSS